MARFVLSGRYPGRRAFVTGAASGLGAAFALALARDGWTVALCDLREEPLSGVAGEVGLLGGVGVVYAFDVTDRVGYRDAVEDFVGRFGGVDLVFNNAGVAGRGEVGEFALEDWDWLIGINLMGVVNGCHFFRPILERQGGGHIINTASAAAFVPVPTMGAYCAAKGGVKILSEVLCNELYGSGVRVSVVMPEFFRTALHERARGPGVERARHVLNRAPYTPEQVAVRVLDRAGRGDLHIVFGARASFFWPIVRCFPGFSMWLIRRDAARMEAEYQAAVGGDGGVKS